MKLARIAFRNIARNRRRSILSGSAISVATMSIVLLFSLMAGMTADLKANMQTYRTGAVRIRNAEFARYERLNPTHLVVHEMDAIMAELDQNEEITALSPRINFYGAYSREDKLYNVAGTGVDFQREEAFQGISDVLLAGRLPVNGQAEGVIGLKMADKLGVNLQDDEPDKITIVTTTADRRKKLFTVEIVGIVGFPLSSLNDSVVLMPLDTTQRLLRMPNAVSEVLIKIDEDATDLDTFNQGLINSIGQSYPELQIKTWMEDNTLWGMMSMAEAMYFIFAIFFFVLGSSVIINTTMMVIFERMREIGTLTAMGMKGKELTKLFFLEAFFISLMGAAAGMLLGMLITQVTSRTGINLGAMMEGMDFDISSILYPKLNFFYTMMTFVFAVGIASLATFLPSMRASRIEPVEALRA